MGRVVHIATTVSVHGELVPRQKLAHRLRRHRRARVHLPGDEKAAEHVATYVRRSR
jgi:hypothetical protein